MPEMIPSLVALDLVKSGPLKGPDLGIGGMSYRASQRVFGFGVPAMSEDGSPMIIPRGGYRCGGCCGILPACGAGLAGHAAAGFR